MIGYALIMCLLDYVLAYTLLGLGGIFRGRFSGKTVEPARRKGREPLELCLGSLVALACRYAAHVLSGYILFSGWAEWFFTQDGFPAWGAALVEKLSPEMLGFAYSLVYNGMYMIPEMILTALAAVLLARVPRIVTQIS
jgi:thiamine transporter